MPLTDFVAAENNNYGKVDLETEPELLDRLLITYDDGT